MLISLHELIQKYNIVLKGILHVGAHECEELNDYEKYLNRNKILWVEALPYKVKLCKNKFQNINIENAIVSDVVENVVFNVSNNGQSSSILEFGLHSHFHPDVQFVHSFEGTTSLLKNILPNYDIEYNFLNFDIQGAELKALKGMENYLSQVDYLYSEVNYWTPCKWGDAFYIKKILLR